MYKTADQLRYPLEVNWQGFVGLQAEVTPAPAAARAFAMQWERIVKNFRAPSKELPSKSSAGWGEDC